MKLLIKGGKAIDPSQNLEGEADLLLSEGCIEAIGPRLDRDGLADDVLVLEATGSLVVPGLIDMHVHLREPGREDAETIETGTRAAARGGFTAVACMPNTDPPLDTGAGIRFVVEKARQAGAVRVFPVGSVTMGRKGEALAEMGELVREGAVAVSDDGSPVPTSQVMRRALEYARMFDIPVLEHAEDPLLSGRGVMHEGRVSTALGLPGIPAASEEVAVARDIALAKLTGGRLHLQHFSTAEAVELLRGARERGLPVTAEVTPHHLILTDEVVKSFDSNYKMNPPLRSSRHREALRQALAEGLIDAVATDHAPHTVEDKDLEFGLAAFGVVGLETAVGLLSTYLVHEGLLTFTRMVEALSWAPARILGLGLGTLAPGAPADITIIDPELEWKVDPAEFASRSANTPFAGWELKGAATATIVGGKPVMLRRELDPDLEQLRARTPAGS